MMQTVVRKLIAQSLLCGAAQFFCPEGRVKRVIAILSAAVICITILSPLRDVNVDLYSLMDAKMSTAQAEITQSGKASEETLRRMATEEACRQYIENKAKAFGLMSVEAAVRVRMNGEGIWMPDSVMIRAQTNAEAKERLSALIQSELGIPKERQEWLAIE